VVLAFGDHRLDIGRRELRQGTELIKLEPKAFDLLAFLAQNRNRVVSKDDLLRAVWNGRVVSESALTTRINAVRRALGDDGTNQRLVRTFVSKGIRFIGDVTELPEASTPAAGGLSVGSDKPSLAVLPFQNLSGNPEQDCFVDGMVEEITTAITRFSWLLVVSRSSSYAYQGTTVDTKQVGHELGVRYLLEGSIRKAGNRVRVTGDLIDAATHGYIWADRFDATLEDALELQDRMAKCVAGAIEPKLRFAEIERAKRKQPQNLDAYDLYLRAQAQVYKRTEQSMAESVQLARRALEIDPDYAPAMARLALSQTMRRNRHWIPAGGAEVEEAIHLARRAIAAGPVDPWVLDFAGLTLCSLAGASEAALSALDRAIVLNPYFALGFGHRALILAYLNKPDQAILSAQEAMRLSPFDPGRFSFCEALALAHLAAGRFDKSLQWAEEGLRENSGTPALRLKLSLCGHLGRIEQARRCLLQLRAVESDRIVASLWHDMPTGLAPEIANNIFQGLRKAGIPEA
jgi:TolB-like protein